MCLREKLHLLFILFEVKDEKEWSARRELPSFCNVQAKNS